MIGLLILVVMSLAVPIEAVVQPRVEDTEWFYYEKPMGPSEWWILPGFPTNDWAIGAMPFYATGQTNGTRLSWLVTDSNRLCLRKEFAVEDCAAVSAMNLRVKCRGGWVAWLNGVEVVRFNLTMDSSGFSAVAEADLSESEATQEQVLPIPTPLVYLYPGTNILALQAVGLASPEEDPFFIDARVEIKLLEKPPQVVAVIPPAGTVAELRTVEVFFDQQVTGVDLADLRANGNYATSFREVSPAHYVFGFSGLTSGPVSLTWIVDHEICGKTQSQEPFGGAGWSYWLDPAVAEDQVVINEFMAVDQNSYKDEDGDSGDWIELRNRGPGLVSLDGWYLTDDAANLTKWRLPNYVMLPGDFLVIHASGKDRAVGNHPLHANFKLDADGDYLALVRADGKTIVSEFRPQYPVQEPNRSCGRAEEDPRSVVFFDEPTPGKPNHYRGTGFAVEVGFSRPSGVFRESFRLSLAAAAPDAVIYYTLDDTVPTEKSPRYVSPLRITHTTVIRARAFQAGVMPGPPRSACYIASNPTTRGFQSDLPVMLIQNSGPDRVSKTEYQPVHALLWEPEQGVTRLDQAVQLESRAGIRLRGASTSADPKRNLNLEWQDEFGRDLDLDTLGMPADSDWVLMAPRYLEPIMIHNPFMFQLSNDIGRYAPRTRFVELFYHVGDGPLLGHDYQGIYVLVERIKRGKHRVAINKLQAWHQQPPEVTGDYLLKLDHQDPDEWGMLIGQLPRPVLWDEPDEDHMLLPQWQPQNLYLRDYLNRFDQMLRGTGGSEPASGYAQFIDVESWIDYHQLNILAYNIDALGLSAYFHKAREGKLVFGPLWDLDRALGSRDGHDENPRSWVHPTIPSSPVFSHPWWEPLFRDPDFWQRYGDRWQELRDGPFSTNHLFTLVDQLTRTIERAQPREVRRWPFSMAPRNGRYECEVEALKQWLIERLAFIDEHFVNPPRFTLCSQKVTAGFSLVLIGPPDTLIYYTLDGSDPRAAGGEIAPTARCYTNALRLTASTQVSARAFDPEHRHEPLQGSPPLPAQWSRLLTGSFEVMPQSQPVGVRINECFLDPESIEPAGSTPGREGWIELYNGGTNTVNLEDYQVAGSINPNGAVVLPAGTFLAPAGFLRIRMRETSGAASSDGDPEVLPLDLSRGRDVIRLLNPEDTVVDAVEFHPQSTGCSLARWPDGGDELVNLWPPTPETANQGTSSRLARIISWTYFFDESVTVTWESVPGVEYRIECREPGDNDIWVPLAHQFVAQEETVSFTVPLAEHNQRQIRVVVAGQTLTITGLALLPGGYLRLSWQTIPGCYYRLERTRNCHDPVWESDNYLVKARQLNESLTIPIPDTQNRFYRFRLVE